MKYVITILACFTILFSCKTTQTTNNGTGKSDGMKIKALIQNEAYREINSSPVTIKSASIKGSILQIDVEYSGGCSDANFELYWDGMLAKSMPPKATFGLVYTTNDTCRKLTMNTLIFDISSVYTGECIIFLTGYEGELRYMGTK